MTNRTPAAVVTAIQTVAAYLRDARYGSAIIAPTGGASFHLRNVLEEKEDLFREIIATTAARRIADARLAQVEECFKGDRRWQALAKGWREG